MVSTKDDMTAADAVSLTKSLLRFDTVNPPGRERECARYAGGLLESWGFRVDYHEYDEQRTSVVARAGGKEGRAPLCLTGHIDTVALGAAPWTRDAFAGETDGDRLYGRGASDMKAGVAALLLAARAFAGRYDGTPGVVLVLTAGEEGGCIGSAHLARSPLLGRAGAIVVGEPTANAPYVGHKGSLKFNARFRGVSAHGSMPELGVNAVYKAARAIAALERFEFRAEPHPLMGGPTLNVGTVHGGDGINMVPDWAAIGVDVRTVPGMDHARLLARLEEALGEAELEMLSDLPPVWTPPEQEWMQRVLEICSRHLGARPQPRTATYMTDAANLRKAYGEAPTVVLGPGEPQMAHQTDEYCSQERVRQAVAIYEALIADWCGL
ncbi:MAG TPA: M20 family metallopeptidase [Burkholderiales bacterium]